MHEHNLDDVVKRFLIEHLGYTTSDYFVALRHTIRGAAKTLTGGPGAVDVYIESRHKRGPVILVESKTRLSDHAFDLENSAVQNPEITIRYALEGVHHYARIAAEQNDVISIAVSGDPERPYELRVTVDLWNAGDTVPFQRDYDGKGLAGIKPWAVYCEEYGYADDGVTAAPTAFGYSRFSEGDVSDLEMQVAILREAGIAPEDIFTAAWGKKADPMGPILQKLKPGDRVLVPSVSRCGYRLQHLHIMVEKIQRMGATIEFIEEGFAIGAEGGNSAATPFLYALRLAHRIDTEVMSGRSREGIHRRKENGGRMGRPSRFSEEEQSAIESEYSRMLESGEYPSSTSAINALTRKYDVSTRTLWRIIKTVRDNKAIPALF